MSVTVIVFGGSGFLGSHVADALSDAGYRVRIFDREHSPYVRPDQEMIVGDIMNLDKVISASSGCKYVYNFAGIADINDAKNRPVDTARINVLGNVHVLEGARINQAERFVFASSLYVYSESGSFYRASRQRSASWKATTKDMICPTPSSGMVRYMAAGRMSVTVFTG